MIFRSQSPGQFVKIKSGQGFSWKNMEDLAYVLERSWMILECKIRWDWMWFEIFGHLWLLLLWMQAAQGLIPTFGFIGCNFRTTNPVSFGRYNSMFPPLRSEKKGFGPTKNPKNLRKMFLKLPSCQLLPFLCLCDSKRFCIIGQQRLVKTSVLWWILAPRGSTLKVEHF